MIKDILKKVRRLEIISKNKINSLFSGNYRSLFRGRGIEFADIRPYDIGDDVRDIDWKTSAKQGEVFVKTYHESRDNTLFFVIDGTADMQFSSTQKTKYEKLLETFALLAFSAVLNGDRVGVLFYDGCSEKIFPPKKGRKNVLKILKFCIEKYKTYEFNFLSKKKLRTKIFKKILIFLKHSSAVFWLHSNNLTLSSTLKKQLKILRAKHDLISIVFTDPLEENFSKLGDYTFQDNSSGRISSMVITTEISNNFRKLKNIKKQKFHDFFKKIESRILWIREDDKIFQKLFLFFKQ